MNQHVVPVGDIIDHPSDEDCVCGPTPQLVKHDDGTDAGWLYIHHSLDGRELRPDTPRWIPDPCVLCGEDTATWSALGRQAHWSNHSMLRRAWLFMKHLQH